MLTMLFDHLVDLLHQTNGFAQYDDDLVVVGDIILRKRAALTVFEPFLGDLVSADVKTPHGLGHSFKIARPRLVEPHWVECVRDFFDLGIYRAVYLVRACPPSAILAGAMQRVRHRTGPMPGIIPNFPSAECVGNRSSETQRNGLGSQDGETPRTRWRRRRGDRFVAVAVGLRMRNCGGNDAA
jgi:hypothetical protein